MIHFSDHKLYVIKVYYLSVYFIKAAVVFWGKNDYSEQQWLYILSDVNCLKLFIEMEGT